MDYNGTMYAYVHNLQGDIVGILDSGGALVVTYSYDAWGKPVQTNGSMANTLGKLNPFRYRGYVFDEETGLYYLQSRYYDSNFIKLINIDSVIVPETEIVGNNKQTYCGNNPIVTVVEKEISPQINENPKREIIREKTKVVCSTNKIYVGAAQDFHYIKGTAEEEKISPNCYVYALGYRELEPMDVGGFCQYFTGTKIAVNIYTLTAAVILDVLSLGRGCRRIASYDSPIAANEYRIAMRIHEGETMKEFDCHFMVQTKTGKWAEKLGPGGDSRERYGNPEILSWDTDKEIGFYTGRIVYFAITAI